MQNVRFLANPGYRGTLPTAITFKAWDEAVGTTGTLYDTTTVHPDDWTQGTRGALLACEFRKYAASQITNYALAA